MDERQEERIKNISPVSLPSLNLAQFHVVDTQEVVYFGQGQVHRWSTSLEVERTVQMGGHKNPDVIDLRRIFIIY